MKTDLFGVVALGLGKPGKEGFGGFAHLLAGWEVNILLTGFRAPFGENLLAQNILVIENHEDLGCLVVDVWVFLASEPNESFHSSKKSLFMSFGRDHLVLRQQ
jgi:hypothetical protein